MGTGQLRIAVPLAPMAKEGLMADKATQFLVDALGRAVAEPAGVPLLATRTAPGLFNLTPAGKQAAQRSKELGYLRVLRTEMRAKNAQEICAITEQGLAFLLAQTSPRQVLEDLVRALEARHEQINDLIAMTHQTQATLEGFRTVAEKVLQQLATPHREASFACPSANGSDVWKGVLLSYLAQWQETRASADCPLPELYRHVHQLEPGLTIGRFHDGVRWLHEHGQIYLHPWTGPLYDLPEPAYAVLAGHEVVYYASLRPGLGDQVTR
jgi:hypothetical protein